MQTSDLLLAEGGGLVCTSSRTKDAYASRPSVSHPIDGKSLKKRLVLAASRACDACLNCRRKMSSSCSRAACRVCTGGSGDSEVGCEDNVNTIATIHTKDRARTTADSAKGPDMTSMGKAMARAQCLVADSQSCASVEDCKEAKEDYNNITHEVPYLERHKFDATFSSMTCPTRSLASLILFISSSRIRTRPPILSAVFAVLETVSDRRDASSRSSSRCGPMARKRARDASIGSCEDNRSASEVDSSASSA